MQFSATGHHQHRVVLAPVPLSWSTPKTWVKALELSCYVDPVLRYGPFPLHSSYESTVFQHQSISALYNLGTSSFVLGDLKNMGLGIGIVQLRWSSAEIWAFSTPFQLYYASVFQHRSKSTSNNVGTYSIELVDLENIGVAVGIVQLRHFVAKIWAFSTSFQLWVHIFSRPGLYQRWTLLVPVPLSRATPKIWMWALECSLQQPKQASCIAQQWTAIQNTNWYWLQRHLANVNN